MVKVKVMGRGVNKEDEEEGGRGGVANTEHL